MVRTPARCHKVVRLIPVRNIYWMLAYAFRALEKGAYERLGSEEFGNAQELCAAILARGVESQVKRGLGRGYVPQTEALSYVRGKIDVSASLKTNSLLKRRLVCSYDEFSTDTPANRIVKATMQVLLRSRDVSSVYKRGLRRLMPYLAEVGECDLHRCDWNVRIGRNNQDYRLLLFVCRLVRDGLLMAEEGVAKAPGFFDDQAACKLYERFILEYYRREHPQLSASASQVPWALDDGFTGALPVMQTDITLRQGDRVLIIDAKYYTHMTQQSYGVCTLHSGNLYQVFTYVKNMQESLPADAPPVSGMLMYARTDEAVLPDGDYLMSGNPISIRSLDLSREFEDVRQQLDAVAEEWF